jgi:cell division protein FtsN
MVSQQAIDLLRSVDSRPSNLTGDEGDWSTATMSDHERGAYTPQPDAPLSFDPRTSREGRPLPLALIASCIVLATLVVALYMFYQSGVRHTSDAPIAVGTPINQFRSRPPVNGQAPANDQAPEGLTVVAAAPPAEAPPPPVSGLTEKPVERGATALVPPPPKPLTPTQPAPTQPAPAQPPPAPPPTAQAPKAQPPPPAAPKAVPAKSAAAPAFTPAPAVVKGAAVVQIGAYLSEAQAEDAWRRVAGLMGGESTGRGRHIEPVDANGVTRYRSQFTGFATRADAAAFCATLKAKGQDCIIKAAN